MRTAVSTLLWLLCISCIPCLAAEEPFKVTYRQENVVQGEATTSADLLLSVTNRSGSEARDVTVSAVKENSYHVINIPIPFGNIPDGLRKELLVPAVIPNLSVSADKETEEVVWKIEFTTSAGETATVELIGEKGL